MSKELHYEIEKRFIVDGELAKAFINENAKAECVQGYIRQNKTITFEIHENEFWIISGNVTFKINFDEGQIDSIRQILTQEKKISSARVRRKESNGEVKSFLTIKGKTCKNGVSRIEVEQEIPPMTAIQMLKLTSGNLIVKTRYYVKFGDHTWEVDFFKNENEGLFLAEIELSHSDEEFELPPFCIRDVTNNPQYTNGSLSKKPFSLIKESVVAVA